MAISRLSNLELVELPNCMGLSETGQCFWLNIPSCNGKRCTFRHSTEEYQFTHCKSFQRLARLSDAKQMRIAKKYYGGKKPWSEK